ncbi:MAG: RtcB family protein [Chloroflexi bacterium]|nr:RtcB family protein [Chloroflexota bacterium]
MKTIKSLGHVEEGALLQAKHCLQEAEAFCLMADNHKGYGMPVGGVAVYKDKICPAGVGFDIACGNKAIKTNLKYEDIKNRLSEIADLIWHNLSFGVGLKNKTPFDHALFHSETWAIDFYKSAPDIKQIAKNQLGTIGSGNHYVDIFRDEDETIWIGVHFGSRGLGHKTASHFMKLAGDNTNIMDETPHLLDVHSKAGQDYLKAMELAGQYAYAGRDWVCATVADLLGAEIVEEIHNHHNFAFREFHNGQEYWVVRKGATPAFPGQLGFVGGSMMDNAVIIRGVDSEKSQELFYSTVHGAGRVMSRTQAAGKVKRVRVWECGNRDCNHQIPHYDLKPNETRPICERCGSAMNKRTHLEVKSEGKVDWAKVKQTMKDRGIELRGAGADEAPEVYKKLDEVLAAHEGTIEILHTLRPIIVCMAGIDEFDPYKD